MQALEVDPGGGYFTIEEAEKIGERGKLYAVDIQLQMIEKARRKVLERKLTNVSLMVGDATNLPFVDNYFDLIFMVSVLGEIPYQLKILREPYRVLKPGGILSITEAFPDGHYILRKNLVKRCLKVGFVPFESRGNFYIYTVNFRKPV